MAHISAFRVAVVDRLDVMCLLVCYHDEATLSGTILPSVFSLTTLQSSGSIQCSRRWWLSYDGPYSYSQEHHHCSKKWLPY